ncbi:MAG TPA: double zinc ribbon domain-containing protein [Pyrinomonadaceae bacterium]|nr:double zinc ribbon domain-containing protein [Pyrinomonadaceae bacterium]
MFLTKASSLIDALLSVAYPQPCRLCQREVESRQLGVVCKECWNSTRIFSAGDSLCSKCGLPLFVLPQNVTIELYCRRCESQTFTAARACGIYEKGLRQSVLELKRKPNIARHLTSLLQSLAVGPPFAETSRIIPVPLHPARQRARGFNQAVVIARSISSALNLPVDEKSLVRTQYSERHRAGLDARGRWDTVNNAFTVPNPRLIKDERILLVDDVLTTGATASSCSNALLEAGASTVCVLTIARSAR